MTVNALEEFTVTVRLHVRSFAALTALLAAGSLAPRLDAQVVRAPGPNTPRMMVPVFRSPDKTMGPQASDALRERLTTVIPFRTLWVIPKNDVLGNLEQSGYPVNEQLSRTDESALAKIVRADEYIRGSVTRANDLYRIEAQIVLTRDQTLTQPLPIAEGDKMDRTAAALVRHIQEARKQMEFEKKCLEAARADKYAEAIAAAEEGIVAYPNATLVRYCKLQVLVKQKAEPALILALSDEILGLDPNSKAALAIAADAHQQAGNVEASTNLLVRLLATEPNNASLATRVVDALAASKKYDVAKEIVLKAVADNPGDVALIRLQFLILSSAGDYKPALKTGEEMVEMDTSLADIPFFERLAALYAADSQPQKSAEAAARGTRKFPNNAGLWALYAQTLQKSGQVQQSIDASKRALAIDPKIANGWTQVAMAYNELNQPDSALAALEKAKESGDDANQVGGFALTIGNRLYRAASAATEEPKPRAPFEAALPYLKFAENTLSDPASKANAVFLQGVSYFYIGVATEAEARKAKSCDLAKAAETAMTLANDNVRAGGRASPQAAAQILPIVLQYTPAIQSLIKNFCK